MAKTPPPRRGASRGPSKKKAHRQVPGWVWLFTGVVAGLFVAFLVHLGGVQMKQGAPATADEQAQTGPTGNKGRHPAKDSKDNQPKFDFYAVLPKMEVIAPKGDDQDQGGKGSAEPEDNDNPPATAKGGGDKTARAPAKSAPADTGQRYMLQAGSFRNESDADKRRANLILKGFQVSIQPVQLDNGDTWHRVMIGPYTTLASLHSAQDKLVTQGVETLPIQVKKQ